MEDTILRKAEARAKEMGFNFSQYLVYLINKDTDNQVPIIQVNATAPEETKKEDKLDKKVNAAIDNILDDF